LNEVRVTTRPVNVGVCWLEKNNLPKTLNIAQNQ